MTAQSFIERLASRGRVMMLGGLAVIAHGLARSTRDVDVWLDPFPDLVTWAGLLRDNLAECPGAYLHDLREHRQVSPEEIDAVVSRDGVIRVGGLDRPVDVFRVPHNLAPDDFEAVWCRAPIALQNVRVPDAIDLLLTKEETARPQDAADVAFLEEKIRASLSETLRRCSPAEAVEIFRRYADHVTCRAALANPDPAVRDLALATLKEFAAAGDPFAAEMLGGGPSPNR